MKYTDCQCSCGHVSFSVHTSALVRIFCHCTICQQFNGTAFGDVNVFLPKNVTLPNQDRVKYDTYKPPPNVERGKCTKCGDPVIEKFESLFLPDLIMVPTPMYQDTSSLLPPSAHVFYDKRVADADDDLPKYEKFLPSQLAFFKLLFKAKTSV